MALKFIIDSEADLPSDETIRGLYSEQGGKWVLGVEGAVPKKQLDEFRTTNIDLKKKLAALGDTDPEEAVKAIRRVEELEAQADKDKDKVKELVEKRTQEMQKQHEAEIQAARKDTDTLRGQLRTLKIDNAIMEAGSEYGLRKGAGPDLIARARSTFDLDEDGNIIARDKDGEPRYNATGEPLAPQDWVQMTIKEAPHLFDESQGGGASGGNKSGSGSGPKGNPWKKETWNITEQSRLFREDADKARRLAAQAGKRI